MSSFLCDSPSDHSHPDSGGRRAQDEERRGTWNLYDIGGRRARAREKSKRKGQEIENGKEFGVGWVIFIVGEWERIGDDMAFMGVLIAAGLFYVVF